MAAKPEPLKPVRIIKGDYHPPETEGEGTNPMEYDIIFAFYSSDLINSVNIALSEGWEAIGGVCVNDGVFYQAIVKKPK